jgi:hypothetical protein
MLAYGLRAIPAGSLARVWVLVLAFVVGVAVGGCAPFAGGGGATGATAPTAQTTPTPAIQGQLAQVVYLNIWGLGVQKLETTYDVQHTTAKVTITLGGTTPNTETKASAAQELTKAFCLMAQQALWTSGAQLDEATVIVQGPLQDEYADTIVDAYGVAVVEAGTAQRIPWATVSVDSAWQAYDHAFLRGSFELVD